VLREQLGLEGMMGREDELLVAAKELQRELRTTINMLETALEYAGHQAGCPHAIDYWGSPCSCGWEREREKIVAMYEEWKGWYDQSDL
jgi:hypothetical protein